MRTISLPNDATAELYDAKEVKGRGRKLVRAAMIAAGPLLAQLPSQAFAPGTEGESPQQQAERMNAVLAKATISPEQAEALDTLREAAVLAQLVSWSLPQPIPTTREELEDLDGLLFDALLAAVSDTVTEVAKGEDFGINPDPSSPTSGSES